MDTTMGHSANPSERWAPGEQPSWKEDTMVRTVHKGTVFIYILAQGKEEEDVLRASKHNYPGVFGLLVCL